jgi:secreted PhoX family phosphatase
VGGAEGCRRRSDRKAFARTRFARRTFVSVFAAGALMTGATIPAMAAPAQQQDGLINVAVGDVSILNDARIGVAAQVAAQVCGVKVGPVAVLGAAVDRSGATRTVCTTDHGPVTLQRNN